MPPDHFRPHPFARDRIAVAGHSAGGFVAFRVAARHPEVVGVAGLAAFDFGAYAAHALEGPGPPETVQSQAIDAAATAGASSAAVLHGATGKGLAEEVFRHGPAWSLAESTPALRSRAVLLIAGRDDDIAIPAIHFTPLVQALRAGGVTRITAHVLPGGHGFEDSREELTRVVVGWLDGLGRRGTRRSKAATKASHHSHRTMPDSHIYRSRLSWEGNRGSGTSTYPGYGRQYRIRVVGKPDLVASAALAFRGDPALHDPEDLFLAAISGCHMLSYLALAARGGVNVVAYEDDAEGTLALEGGGRFVEVVLHPRVTVADPSTRDRALELHRRAHELCYIANSCSVPIRHEATITVQHLSGGRA